jgi:hypothetical protein
MWKLRLIGAVLVVWGAMSLLALGTSYEWLATDYSIARYASTADRRIGNEVQEVDEPMVIAGGAVAIFTGLWIGLLVPYVMNRNTKRMMREAGEAGEAGDGGP